MEVGSILIPGGAGFVGSNLAVRFKQRFPDLRVVALDNLTRRGSELNLPRLRAHGVQFINGDVRREQDLLNAPPCELILDCAAEPSVQAGLNSAPHRVVESNFNGAFHCLEAARRWDASLLFLSTSRVYPIPALNALPFYEDDSRFRWITPPGGEQPGVSTAGVTETFPLDGPRSLYGTTKLSAEMLIQEYVFNYGVRAIINRCGVLAGPWQMGKVDQGVVGLWVAAHHYERSLRYIGFGGQGKQVRDVLHVDDLFELILKQLAQPEAWNGPIYNVGGGIENSVSLAELTELCQATTGRAISIGSHADTSPVDLRIFVTDSQRVKDAFHWQPQLDVPTIVEDTHQWLMQSSDSLQEVLA